MSAPPLPTGRPPALRSRLAAVALGLVLPCALVLIWEAGVQAGRLPRTLVSSPSDVANRLWVILTDGSAFGHIRVSLWRLACGFAIGTVCGVVLGTLVGYSRPTARLVEPLVLGLIPVPPIAWIPLLIILFGIGDVSKIALISVGSFCTLFLHTAHAVRSAERNLVEVGYVLEKGDAAMLFRLFLPSAVPDIAAAMRVALALSWTLLLCGEIIASSKGLGWLIWDARNFSRPDDMIAGMVLVAALGLATDAGLAAAGRWLTRWRRTYQDRGHE